MLKNFNFLIFILLSSYIRFNVDLRHTNHLIFISFISSSLILYKKKNNEQYYFNGAENLGKKKKYKCIDFERYVNFFKHVMGTNFCILDYTRLRI